MLRPHDIPGTHYEQVPVAAAAAADTTAIVGTWAAPFKCEIVSIELVPSAAFSGVNTNSRNINVQLADGTEIANADFTNNHNGVAGTPYALTLTGTTAQKTLAAGAGLKIQSEKAGNGLALPIGNIRIGFRGA